jgi:hypothetical protein
MKVAEITYHCFPLKNLLFLLICETKAELQFNTAIYSTLRLNSG